MKTIEERIKASHVRRAWEKIGIRHHHGINVALFSIHSKQSCGIGEFLDLKLLIDFCSLVSFGVIQLLPLNDSGFETSPYNAVSSQALNPIYLSLYDLPFVQNDRELKEKLSEFKPPQKKINYLATLSAKLGFLTTYYKKYFDHFEKTNPYLLFLEQHPWVYDYGLFKTLKDQYHHKGWFSWEKNHQDMTHTYKKQLFHERSFDINFYIFLQFLSFTQLEEVKRYAGHKGILLQGDIPILISPESLDVWSGRENFNLDYCAGSPPDIFTPKGQNWGFPIYNWSHMEETHYSFWQDRLKTASLFYHMFRIDHIIGLYRIYAIPRKSRNNKGSFIPNSPPLALMQGERILEKLTSYTSMLPIGEDLGVDIEYIRKSLSNQAIPGIIIPRWERDHFGDHSFTPYSEYNPFSLTTVSTHDSETLSQWWKNNTEEVRHFCEGHGLIYQEELTHKLRYQMLKDSHMSASLFHINLLSEYLALFDDLVWKDPKDERINQPGTVLPTNWCYRMKPSLETLLDHSSLKLQMISLLKNEKGAFLEK